jgi:hypothetical protein
MAGTEEAMGTTWHVWLLATAIASLVPWRVRVVAQDYEYYDAYDYYEGAYDDQYDDDWFFDSYEYDSGAYDGTYDYYTDAYDYESGAFDWEESDLFGGTPP